MDSPNERQDSKITDKHLREAVNALIRGGLVVFPTETVYGIGTNPLFELSVHRLYRAKRRARRKPLTLHMASLEQAYPFVEGMPPAALALADAFWPGPLTIILRRSEELNSSVVGGGATVGLRVPDNDATRRVAELAGVPIAGTSANISGWPSPVTAQDALRDLEGEIDAYVDTGPAILKTESAVLDLTTTPFKLIRPGKITQKKLTDALRDAGIDTEIVAAPAALYEDDEALGLRVVIVKGDLRETLIRCLADATTELARGGSAKIIIPEALGSREDMKQILTGMPELSGTELLVQHISEGNLYESLRDLEVAGVNLVLVPASLEEADSLVMDRISRRARTTVDETG